MLGAIATGLASSNSNYSSYAPYSSSPTQEFGNISTTSSRKKQSTHDRFYGPNSRLAKMKQRDNSSSSQSNFGNSNSAYPYKSSTGNNYKYDLNNPSDKLQYSVDPSSQLTDSINPMIQMDRSMGQYGGGIQ